MTPETNNEQWKEVEWRQVILAILRYGRTQQEDTFESDG